MPGCVVLVIAFFLYNQFGLSYALFLSPLGYLLAMIFLLVASTLLTLLALNVYWAYEGNLTRRQKRPNEYFKNGSKRWCVLRHCAVVCASVLFLSTHFHEALPHALLYLLGKPVVHELVVDEKGDSHYKGRRTCWNLVVAHSSEYRSDKLCLESNELYAEVEVGDTLVVEGKANWIGLLVSKPLALRDADSGLEHSLSITLFSDRPTRHQLIVQVEDRG